MLTYGCGTLMLIFHFHLYFVPHLSQAYTVSAVCPRALAFALAQHRHPPCLNVTSLQLYFIHFLLSHSKTAEGVTRTLTVIDLSVSSFSAASAGVAENTPHMPRGTKRLGDVLMREELCCFPWMPGDENSGMEV